MWWWPDKVLFLRANIIVNDAISFCAQIWHFMHRLQIHIWLLIVCWTPFWKGVLADGMYDSNKNFRYLSKKHIKPGIKIRSNSKVRPTNCQARNMSVIRQQKNLKRWKRSVSYGHRWMAESVFSSIKRTFGEYVTARKFQNMAKELMLCVTV